MLLPARHRSSVQSLTVASVRRMSTVALQPIQHSLGDPVALTDAKGSRFHVGG
jgi:hypothetical protein